MKKILLYVVLWYAIGTILDTYIAPNIGWIAIFFLGSTAYLVYTYYIKPFDKRYSIKG